MLDYYEWVDRFERLPSYEVTGSVGARHTLATDARPDGTTDLIGYLRSLVDRWTRRHDAADHQTSRTSAHDHCADELLESIEDSEADARFVPDWADESFKTAA